MWPRNCAEVRCTRFLAVFQPVVAACLARVRIRAETCLEACAASNVVCVSVCLATAAAAAAALRYLTIVWQT